MAKKVSLPQLRKELLREQARLRDRLNAVDTALKGIAAVIDLNLADIGDSDSTAAADTNGTASLKDRIVAEARRQLGPFTSTELYEILCTRFADRRLNKTTVSHALREAAERGELQVLQRGAGKRPTMYRTTGQSLEIAEMSVGFDPEGDEDGAETSGEVPAP
jgi:hypothetical protein